MTPDSDAVKTFTIPPELSGSSPRKVSLSEDGIESLTLFSAVLAFGVLLGIWLCANAIQDIRGNAALHRNSSEVRARIQRLWHSGRHSTAHVGYEFEVAGKTFRGESEVPYPIAPDLHISDSLYIRYFPYNPSINHPVAWEYSVISDWSSLLMSAIPFALIIAMIQRFQSERRLLAHGTPAIGKVICCVKKKRALIAQYEFRTADGITTEGEGWIASALEAGTEICVIYLPNKPSRSAPYPLANYRVS